MLKFLQALLIGLFLLAAPVAMVSCGDSPVGAFYYGSFAAGEQKIIIGTDVGGSYSVSMYSLEGELLSVLANYAPENLRPRGLAFLDHLHVLVVLDGSDVVEKLSIFGDRSSFISSAQLSGNLYQMAYKDGQTFNIESNVIESFDSAGARIGNPRIATTVGSCTLSTSRGLTFNSSGNLVVVGTGNDDINVYDVSSSGSTSCVTANTTLGNVNPVAVLSHSNGLLYVATQGDDQIYSFSGDATGSGTVVWSTNTSVINNPSSLLELPDGTILVASDGTNDIVRMDTSGNILNDPFIQSFSTGLVSQMILTPEGN